jgi:glutamate-1-semialdehyde 2,1-aminomutase
MSQVASATIESQYHDRFPTSRKLYERAAEIFPNGVTHDGRFHQPFPVYVDHAQGSKKWDVDGNRLIDYWVGHGSLLLGHSCPEVVEAVERQASRGTHLGASHELEIIWGEWVKKLVPSAERIRFVSSGTEATLMALRLVRIFTGKTKVVKFAGHFHGWHDALIPGADAPLDDYRVPGVTDGVMQDLVILPPNDLAAVEKALVEHDPACVILEATGGHFGVVPVGPDFLRGLRELTARHDVVLIFDEVISGFRVHPSCAQGLYGVTPDMTVLAKVLAGGLPGGCVAGRREILGHLEFGNPSGRKMKHPGTFNANPLSAVAGAAALEIVSTGEPTRKANGTARRLRAGLNRLFAEKGVDWVSYGEFSGVKIVPSYQGPRPASDDFIPYNNQYDRLDVPSDPKLSRALRCALLLGGIDLSGWRGMTSSEHTDEDIDATVAAFAQAIDLLREDGLLA